jgi:hypothetical protein
MRSRKNRFNRCFTERVVITCHLIVCQLTACYLKLHIHQWSFGGGIHQWSFGGGNAWERRSRCFSIAQRTTITDEETTTQSVPIVRSIPIVSH